MQELNSSNSLWKPFEPVSAGQRLEGASRSDQGIQDSSDLPNPICCWNICNGVYVPIASPRSRRKPSAE